MEDEAPESQSDSLPINPAQLLAVFRMQWPIILVFSVVVFVVAAAVTLRTTPKYRATATLQVSTIIAKEVQVEGAVNVDQQVNNEIYMNTQLQLLQAPEILDEVVRRYEALGLTDFSAEDGSARRLDGMLSITPRKNTEFVDVTVVDTDPQRAARLANLMAEVFEEKNLDARTRSSIDGMAWTDVRTQELTERIQQQSEEIIAYQREHNLADADQATTALDSRIASLTAAYTQINTERLLLEVSMSVHERLLRAGEFEEVAKDMGTPALQNLYASYVTARTTASEAESTLGKNYPDMKSYRRLETSSLELLETEVKRELRGEGVQVSLLKSKETDLQREIDLAKTALLEREQLRIEFERMKLDLQRSQESYTLIGQRRDELELASKTQLNNVRRVESANAPKSPFTPNIPRNLGIALAVGLLGGFAIGLAREFLDDSISSPLDVTAYLRVPFLGFIPRIEGQTDEQSRIFYIHEHPNSAAAESIRAMRTLLEFNRSGKALRRLLVTSSVSSEGKTSTSISLATSFASLGRRTLIIDADMRRPRLHHLFDIPKELGLSAVLSGQDESSAIRPTGLPGLDALAAGPSTERPNELLASPEMVALLDRLSTRYDTVIIDTPPSAMLSDAAALCQLVDGVVMVAREHAVSRRLVRDVLSKLQHVGAPILGVVVNAVDMQGQAARYNYYYGYRYRYDRYYQEETKPGTAAK